MPIANATPPAAVAEADPADEPLEPRSGFHGLRVRSPNHTSPIASAPTESFAIKIAPASSSRCTTVAVASSCWCSYAFAPQVVG